MKHSLLICLVAIFLFTGCSKEKLICEKKKKNAGYDYTEKYEFEYNEEGNKLKKINLSIVAIYNEFYTDDEIEQQYTDVQKYCSVFDLADEKLITCNASRDGNIVNVGATIEVNKIDDESFEKMMYVTKEEISNIKDTKKMLDNVGYSCK